MPDLPPPPPVGSAAAPDLRTVHRRAVVLMMAGIGCFVLNDGLVKLASQTIATAQLLCVRGAMATGFLLLIAAAVRQPLRLQALTDRRVLARAVIDALATFSYVGAIVHMALAEATAVNMATPLIMTLLGAMLLGQRVRPGRWVIILAGFVGVLLIVQPAGSRFNAWSLLMLFSATLTACRDLLTPSVRKDIPVLQISLVATLAVTLLAAAWSALSPVQGWQSLAPGQLLLLAAAAACQAGAYLLVTTAFRQGVLSTLAPLRYCSLLYSALLGYAVWGYVPNAAACFGMAIVVLSGLRLIR